MVENKDKYSLSNVHSELASARVEERSERRKQIYYSFIKGQNHE